MKWKQILAGILSIALLGTAVPTAGMEARAETVSTDVSQVGTVDMQGDPDFDSDSIKNEDDTQWRWLSYPESRMAMNYGKRSSAKYDGGMNLRAALVVNGFQKKESMHKIQMGPKTGTVGDYKKLQTVWYPYKLTADAEYASGKLHMEEFFADKDTYIRYLSVSEAADAQLEMSAKIDGIEKQNDGTLLIEQKDYWLVYRFLKLNTSGSITGLYEPTVAGEQWNVTIPFETAEAKVAFAMTMMPKNVEGNSKEAALKLASDTVGINTRIPQLLSDTKELWDGKLAKVPMPQNWGVEGNGSNEAISADQHRRSFYAAWAFQYQNIVEPTPERDYNYYQVTLGIVSTWAHGAASAPNSCSWESLFNIQELAYVEPEIAWDAMKGFIYSIDDNGILDGECLPSQKAHTAWVCYVNMLSAFPERKAELDQEMKSLYTYIRKYLLWRAENPRWIYGGENFSNERDISFVTQWYSDVDFAIKMAKMLGENSDVAMFESLKTRMGEESREWFFKEYDTTKPDSKNNRIMAFCFLLPDGGQQYNWSGSSHNGTSDDALNYVYEALFADFPKDLIDQLVHSYLDFTGGKEDEPLLGFKFYKYGDGCHTAYGLMEREQQYPELQGKWKTYVNAVLSNAIKNVDFAECLRVNGSTTKLEGVEPSSFNASAVIDYTYMINGLRIDMGEPTAVGDSQVQKNKDTDVSVFTIKETKPELPKTVSVTSGNGEAVDALVIWPEIPKEKYAGTTAQSSFEVEGSIYGTSLKATATVHVYSGEVELDKTVYRTTVGQLPVLDQTVAASYTGADGKIHYCVVEIDWNKISEQHVAYPGESTVTGVVGFNKQKVSIILEVAENVKIAGLDQISQYDATQMKLVNPVDDNKAYENVKWSIIESGYDAKAGINQSGKLIAVKPGEVVVKADALDEEGRPISAQHIIQIKEKNTVSFSYGAKTAASGSSSSSTESKYAVDAEELTWWRSNNNQDNQWFEMEMKKEVPVNGMKIRWYEGNQPGAMMLKVSADGENWNTVFERKSKPGSGRENYSEIIVLDETVSAKYVRMESTKAGDHATGIVEFEVYGKPDITEPVTNLEISPDISTIEQKGETVQMSAQVVPNTATDDRIEWSVTNEKGGQTSIATITSSGILIPQRDGKIIVEAKAVDGSGVSARKEIEIRNQELINVALNKSASAGTNNKDAYKAIDGDLSTRWGSSEYPSQNWFQIDLGNLCKVYTIELNFEVSHGKNFKLLSSTDGKNWQTLEDVTDNSSLNCRYGLAEPVETRYLKLDVSKPSSSEWGFSLWEFSAYGIDLNEVDKTDLRAVYDTYADEQESDYSADTWAVFEEALVNAKTVLDNRAVTVDDVEAAKQNLEAAAAGLGVDKSELEQAINDAESLTAADYTPASWNEFQKVLTEANTIKADQDAVQSEINQAIRNLNEKSAELVLIPQKALDTLREKVEAAEALNEADYSRMSYQRMKAELDKAKALLGNPDAEVDEVKNQLKALEKAVNALTERYVVSLEVAAPDKTTYNIGEDLDTTGMKVYLIYDNETCEELISGYEVNGFRSDQVAQVYVKVSSDGFHDGFIVTVEEKIERPDVSKTELQDLVSQMEDVEDIGYTTTSWCVFNEKLEEARSILANIDADQEEINLAYNILTESFENLTEVPALTPVSTTELLNQIQIAEENMDLYSVDSRSQLEELLEAARVAAENDEIIQQQVDEIMRQLKTALITLEKETLTAPDQQLTEMVSIAGEETENEELYKPESWQQFQAALADAEELLAEIPLPEDTVLKAAIDALSDGYAGLKLKLDTVILEESLLMAQDILAAADNYAPESISGIQTALDAAENMLLQMESTQEDVAGAIKDLNKELCKAYKKADKTALIEAIKTAQEKEIDDYTSETVNALLNALTNAKAAEHDENVRQTEVNRRHGELVIAIEELKPKEKVISVLGVKLDKQAYQLAVGESVILNATVVPENAADKRVSWQSSSTDIAAVDENGKVTAKAKGTAVITATTKDGDYSAACKITVMEKVIKDPQDPEEPEKPQIKVTKIILNMRSKDLKVKKKVQLKASITPANATDQKVTWKSSNPKVAAVNSAGVVTAKKKGKATITATVGGKTAKVTIRVNKKYVAVKKVKLNKSKLVLNAKGSYKLKATLSPKKVSNKKLIWSSSDTKVATIDNKGKIKAKNPGKTVITVKSHEGGKTAKCVVTVKGAITKLKLNKTKATLTKGKSLKLKATVQPSSAKGAAFFWKSSNPKIASVDAKGRVKAIKAGKAKITVTAGNKKVTCMVTVK